MELKDAKFYVVSLGKQKFIETEKNTAIQKLVELVNKSTGNVEALKPEIVEVDTTEEQWKLKGLAWNMIALELMRMK